MVEGYHRLCVCSILNEDLFVIMVKLVPYQVVVLPMYVRFSSCHHKVMNETRFHDMTPLPSDRGKLMPTP